MIEGTMFEDAWELLAKWCPGNRNRRHEIEWTELTAINSNSKNIPYHFKDRRCIHCGLRDAFIEEGDS